MSRKRRTKPLNPISPAPDRPVFKPEISLEEFRKVDLRVGRIIKAEAVPKAKKLLRLEVDLGENRTIVAGIAGVVFSGKSRGQTGDCAGKSPACKTDGHFVSGNAPCRGG